MLNTGKLAGKTIVITGGSRGIGKAIGLKAARDGANIVIAAKTVDPHPTLPGTIYTAAEEIEKAGGKCLPCVVDVRDEGSVDKAVEETVKKFGKIDILVNNASAISLTGTLATPMKRYDLMNQINSRGTYLMSQKCLPYMRGNDVHNAHILNISPPLNMDAKWFAPHVAYTMAKYGMSMCVLGMAEEFKADKVAVNALWPRTAIWTAAMAMLGGGESIKPQCRTDEIMADAAYVIMCKNSGDATGNFYIDDEVLRDVGVTDFDKYACEPGHPLLPDFFLEEALSPEATAKKMKEHGAKPKFSGSATGSTPVRQPSGAAAGGASIESIFETIQSVLNDELASATDAIYAFNITGPNEGTWHLTARSGEAPSCGSGSSPLGDADCTMTMDSADFVSMFTGKLKPTAAFMGGKLKIQGNMGKALKLEKIMGQMASKLHGSGGSSASSGGSSGSAGGGSQIDGIFEKIRSVLSEDVVSATDAIYSFKLTGSNEGTWHLTARSGESGSCGSGSSPLGDADCTMTMDSADFVSMFTGKLKPTAAFMGGKLKIQGNMGKALKLEKLMGQMKSKL